MFRVMYCIICLFILCLFLFNCSEESVSSEEPLSSIDNDTDPKMIDSSHIAVVDSATFLYANVLEKTGDYKTAARSLLAYVKTVEKIDKYDIDTDSTLVWILFEGGGLWSWRNAVPDTSAPLKEVIPNAKIHNHAAWE